jgi:ketosteroid isomerase-like protein
MSQENVELVRAAFHAWQRGGLDAVAEFWDARIDWRAAEGALDDPGPIRGMDAMRAYLQDWLDDFDELSIEPEELIDAGEQVVAGAADQRACEGRAASRRNSGTPSSTRSATARS